MALFTVVRLSLLSENILLENDELLAWREVVHLAVICKPALQLPSRVGDRALDQGTRAFDQANNGTEEELNVTERAEP